jgi:hypothetical protein
MRRHPYAIAAAIFVALGVAFAMVQSQPTRAERDARVLREEAHKRGFKLEPADFAFVQSDEEHARAGVFSNNLPFVRALLITATCTKGMMTGAHFRHWDTSDRKLRPNNQNLDAMAAMFLEGRPIRFSPEPGDTSEGMWPINQAVPGERSRTALLEAVVEALSERSWLALNYGESESAWADLLACNAAAARYVPGPFYAAHNARNRLVQAAFDRDRKMVAGRGWPDHRLAEMERLWRDVELFRGLDESAMSTCANLLQVNAAARRATGDPLYPRPYYIFKTALSNPGAAFDMISGRIPILSQRIEFNRRTSFIDDARIIRFYEQRVEILRRALACETWHGIRTVTGLENPTAPELSYSQIQSLGLMKSAGSDGGLFPADDHSEPVSSTVRAEAQRRVLLAAIIVERARLRLGHLPTTLAEAGEVPPDFMDGKPLRYRTHEDGTYYIHSVGFDLVDDDGKAGSDDIAWPWPVSSR